MMHLDEEIRNLEGTVREIRRDLHRIPETGLKEFKTSKYIKDKLKSFGFTRIDDCLETGIVAVLEGEGKGMDGKKSETIAFRSDIDALPVAEPEGCAFRSEHEGWMHACGHDGHMATLLGFAKLMSDKRQELTGDVVFVFQPAEEGPGGAELMVKEGIIEKYEIRRFVGMHLYPEYPEGVIACRKGPMMARNGESTIRIKGVSSHGAQPQKGADALVAASAVVLALQTAVSRNVSPLDPSLLTIGKINGGEARNVIAREIELVGTQRGFSDEVYELLCRRIEEISKGVAQGYGCSAEVDFFHMYRVVDNDPEMVDALIEAVGQENYAEAPLQMISEDFSIFQREVPGVFFFVGCRNEEKGYTKPLHNSGFQFDEAALLQGIQAYKNLLGILRKADLS